jgi:hypothetical protein
MRSEWHGTNGVRKRQWKRKGDVVGSSILAMNNAYGHSRPGQTCYEWQKGNMRFKAGRRR